MARTDSALSSRARRTTAVAALVFGAWAILSYVAVYGSNPIGDGLLAFFLFAFSVPWSFASLLGDGSPRLTFVVFVLGGGVNTLIYLRHLLARGRATPKPQPSN